MLLQADNITAGYGIRPVLQNVSLQIDSGEFVGLIGSNGSGKSTLLRVLSGFIQPQSGKVTLLGSSLQQLSPMERARKISFVPQKESTDFDFTVMDLTLMGRHPHTHKGRLKTEDFSIARQSLASTDILPLADRTVGTLSGGEHRRVLLARGLAQQGQLMLLDEPTAHLDLSHQAELMELLSRISRQKRNPPGVVAALHDLNQAAEYCTRLILLNSGRIVADGTPDQVLTEQNLLSACCAEARIGRNPVTGKPMILTLSPVSETANRPEAVKVHLVCGGGSGISIMSRMSHEGFHVSVGALNRLDSDEVAATALGLEVSVDEPFCAISESVVNQTRKLMKSADLIVVADVPFGAGNLINLKLVDEAARNGTPVLFAGNSNPDDRDFVAGEAAAILRRLSTGNVSFSSPEELLTSIKNLSDSAASHSNPASVLQ